MTPTPRPARPSDVTATKQFYVTRPTKTTVFMRTFLPWQLWRFVVINLKMVGVIRRSHRTHRPN